MALFALPLFMALLVAAPVVPVAPVGPLDAPPLLGFGIGLGGADEMAAAGVPADHLQTWAGWWNVEFKGLAQELADADARGATLVIEWYYWGDPLRPDCWKTACDGRTLAAWKTKTTTLADVIAASGTSPVVVVESEFNKNGIADAAHAPGFDQALADIEAILHARAPRAQVALGFGAWGFEQWSNFPKALAGADLVGIQAMAALPRQGEDGVVGLAEKTLGFAQRAHATFGKPVVVHDVAIASYPEPDGYVPQAQAIQAFFDRADAFEAAGVVAIVYRALTDAPQAGHFGAAEGSFGLATREGAAKAAWWAWVSGIATTRAA